jgi:hypothetical protein
MRQANAICRLVEVAAEQASRPTEARTPIGAGRVGTPDGSTPPEVLTLGL